jgi:hypothetical protein
MPITFNNGVANIVGTPGAASGVFSNRPNAADVADGTLYFSTDTVAIYQAVAGSWVNYSGGGGGSTGVNGLNGTTNIGLGGTFLNDTSIDCLNFELSIFNIKILSLTSTNNTKFTLFDDFIKTQYVGNDIGLKLDFANNNFYLGDFDNIVSGIYIKIDENNQNIRTYTNNGREGLNLDIGSSQYCLGDWDQVTTNGNAIIIDNLNNNIFTRDINDQKGLKFNFTNNTYQFGDFNGQNQQTAFIINDANQIIKTTSANNEWGVKLDFANYQYSFGNNSGLNNSTHILIDDNNPKINFVNDSGFYNLKNMPAYTDNADALANGLVVGDLYRHAGVLESQDQLRIVH